MVLNSLGRQIPEIFAGKKQIPYSLSLIHI